MSAPDAEPRAAEDGAADERRRLDATRASRDSRALAAAPDAMRAATRGRGRGPRRSGRSSSRSARTSGRSGSSSRSALALLDRRARTSSARRPAPAATRPRSASRSRCFMGVLAAGLWQRRLPRGPALPGAARAHDHRLHALAGVRAHGLAGGASRSLLIAALRAGLLAAGPRDGAPAGAAAVTLARGDRGPRRRVRGGRREHDRRLGLADHLPDAARRRLPDRRRQRVQHRRARAGRDQRRDRLPARAARPVAARRHPRHRHDVRRAARRHPAARRCPSRCSTPSSRS